MKQRHRLMALAVVVALSANACGGTSDATVTSAADSEASTTTVPSTTTTNEVEGAFPVTIEHKFGTTTIESEPERVAVVGLTEQDVLLALGVVPVATTEWFGEYEGAIWPWAQDELDALGGETPEVMGDATAINFEAVAAQDPDLILAVYSGPTEEDYENLSAIAPTVAAPEGYVDYGVPWDVMTNQVGTAIGMPAEAADLVDQVEQRFDQAVGEHPEFEGAVAVMATPYEGLFVYSDQDVRGRLLSRLGFELPSWLAEAAGDEFGATLSIEEADQLDLDAVVWLDALAAGEDFAGPVYPTLPVHTEGREIHLSSFEDPLGGATSFVTPLSLPYLLDGIVPMLAAALDGDPDTVVDGSAADDESDNVELDADQQEAADVWSLVFDSTLGFEEKVPHLEGAEELSSTIEEYGVAGDSYGRIYLEATDVTIDGEAATVTYDVLFGENPAYTDLSGTMTLVDGTWTVSRDEFCGFMASARTPCPETEE